MKNLKHLKTFESLLGIPKKTIEDLPSYRTLKKIGFVDVTTERVWKNENFTFSHPFVDGYHFTATNTGYVRRIPIGGTPGVLKSFEPVNNIEDWEVLFNYLARYAIKNIFKSKKTLEDFDYIGFWSDLIDSNNEEKYNIFDNILQELSQEEADAVAEVMIVSGDAKYYKFFDRMLPILSQEKKDKIAEIIGMSSEKLEDFTKKMKDLDSLGFF